ncbi:MAG: hypothetical protein LBP78_00970 [Acidaminococcales bacterium]|nr:hypothetical protein [Acidaminococcales bacterium]
MAVIIIVYFLINRLGIAIKFVPLLTCGVVGLFLGLVLPRFLAPQLSMAGTILLVLFFMFVLSVVLAWIFGRGEYAELPDKARGGVFKVDEAAAVLPPAADNAEQSATEAESAAFSTAAAITFKDGAGKQPEDDYLLNDGFEPTLLNASSFNVLRYAEPVLEKIAARVFPGKGKIRLSSHSESFKESGAAVAREYNLACDGMAAAGKDIVSYGDDYKYSWFLQTGERIMAVLTGWKLAVPAGREISTISAKESEPADGADEAILASDYHLPYQNIDSELEATEYVAAGEDVSVYIGCLADVPSWAAAVGGRGQDDLVYGGCLNFTDCYDEQSDCSDVDKMHLNQKPIGGESYAKKTESMIAAGPAPICPCLAAGGAEQGLVTTAAETYSGANAEYGFARDGQMAEAETCGGANAEGGFAQEEQEFPPAAEIHRVLPADGPCRLTPEKESCHTLGDKACAGAAQSQESGLFEQPQYAYTQKHCQDEDLPYKRPGDEGIKVMEKNAEQPPSPIQVPKSDSFDDLLDFAFAQKEQGNWDNALLSLQMAYAMYPRNEFALLIIVETANIYKQMGNYDMAIAELQKGIEKITAENMRHDFILNIGYLRIIKNILKTNGIALLPYNEIPDKVKEDIEKEYLEWKSLSK